MPKIRAATDDGFEAVAGEKDGTEVSAMDQDKLRWAAALEEIEQVPAKVIFGFNS